MAVGVSFSELLSSRSFRFGKPGRTEKKTTSDPDILIIEDDYFVAQVMSSTCLALGLKSVIAESGNEAILLFEEFKNCLSYIIVDFDIPGIHSSRVVSHIRDSQLDFRIVLSSGHNIDRIESCFPMSEVDWFIPKPFSAQQLLESLSLCDVA